MAITIALVLSGFVLLVAATLRAATVSLLRTPRADALRDAAEEVPGADRCADLLDDRVRLQPALGIVHSALLVAAAIAGAWAMARIAEGVGLLMALVAVWLIVVFAGDVMARAYGRARPTKLAYRWSWLLALSMAIGRRAGDLIVEFAEEDEEAEESDQEEEERRLISSVLEFSDTLVREVMVPRPDMVTIGRDATTDQLLDLVIEAGYSRIPVVGESIDDVVGLVYAKDLLEIMDRGGGSEPVTKLMRPPYFVPETKRVPDLLRDMQARQQHLAIVVDEFGGTAGLVTIEDLLEELVGEIIDEYDSEEPLLVEQTDGELFIDGRFPVEDLAEMLDIELPKEEWDTVGGLILDLAGRVPLEGERFEVSNVTFEVVEVQGRRVTKIRVVPAR